MLSRLLAWGLRLGRAAAKIRVLHHPLPALVLVAMLPAALPGQNPLTAVFPSAVLTDEDFPLPVSNWRNRTTAQISAVDTLIPVGSISGLRYPTIVSIENESIRVCSGSANVLTVCPGGRGLLSTAAIHPSGQWIQVAVDQYYFLRTQVELKAVQAALGAGLSNLTVVSGAKTPNKQVTFDGSGQLIASAFDVGSGGVADPGSTGVMVRTALNVSTARSLTGTVGEILISNGDGVAGNPTLSLAPEIARDSELHGDGANCASGRAAAGVDAAGAAQDCTAYVPVTGEQYTLGLTERTTPTTPSANAVKVFVSSSTGKLSALKDTGSVVSLEEQGGASTTTGYPWAISAQTSGTLLASTHGLGARAFVAAAYDASGNQVFVGSSRNGSGDISFDATAPFTGTIEIRNGFADRYLWSATGTGGTLTAATHQLGANAVTVCYVGGVQVWPGMSRNGSGDLTSALSATATLDCEVLQ